MSGTNSAQVRASFCRFIFCHRWAAAFDGYTYISSSEGSGFQACWKVPLCQGSWHSTNCELHHHHSGHVTCILKFHCFILSFIPTFFFSFKSPFQLKPRTSHKHTPILEHLIQTSRTFIYTAHTISFPYTLISFSLYLVSYLYLCLRSQISSYTSFEPDWFKVQIDTDSIPSHFPLSREKALLRTFYSYL